MSTPKRKPLTNAEDVSEGIASIEKEFIKHPMFQDRVRTSPSIVVGTAELAWRRGQQNGIYDSYKTLKRKYPEAAEYLLAVYGMNEKGGSF